MRLEIESVPLSGITVDTLDNLPVLVQRVRKSFAVMMRIPETEEEVDACTVLLTRLVRARGAKAE